jgi:hypothetical protein
MGKRSNVRNEITEKERILTQLEGVYRTTSDPVQRKRVGKEIKSLRESISNLKILQSIDQDLVGFAPGDEISESVDIDTRGFRLLGKIPVRNVIKKPRDDEMDAAISYAHFFETNYLPILSEYYLKLDYSHSMRRDTFYPRFMEIKMIVKEYEYEVEVRSKEEYDTIASFKDKSAIHKVRYRYFLALNDYFKDLRTFLASMVEDVRKGGTVVLNPEDVVQMDEFENDRALDGLPVIDALPEIHLFAEEFIRFLKMPNISNPSR